jgi:8-oxo-dGTP diphosphatase
VIIDFAASLTCATAPEPRAATDVSEARWVALPDLAGYVLVEGLAAAIAAARSGRDTGFQAGLRFSGNDGRLFLPARSEAAADAP